MVEGTVDEFLAVISVLAPPISGGTIQHIVVGRLIAAGGKK
jgi:hypothetical protein